jgi:outer membrane protein assembly factor BamB
VPNSLRMLMSHNAGYVCAGEQHVFAASGSECWMLAANTGEKVHEFVGPNGQNRWGYVGTVGNYLIGSNQKSDVSRVAAKGLRQVNAQLSKSMPAVSENLFVIDLQTRKLLWIYAGGAILNTTITVTDDSLFFAESKNPVCLQNESGMVDMMDFVASSAWVVALDLATGEQRWRKPLLPKTDEAQWIMFLSYSQGILLSTRTYWRNDHFTYELHTMDAATGEDRWTELAPSPVQGPYAPLINGKNAMAAHPSIVAGKVYWLAHTFGTLFCHDLLTGKSDHDTTFGTSWQNKGCAPPTASAGALYYRDTSCHMVDLATRKRLDLTKVTRPGCWMSMIPAGGLLLMPEASSGCTCGFALQMSVALAPCQ